MGFTVWECVEDLGKVYGFCEVDEGFKKRVSDIVVTYYKTYDDGTTEMYQILNTDKDKVDIIITTTDGLSGEKYKYTIRAKRIN